MPFSGEKAPNGQAAAEAVSAVFVNAAKGFPQRCVWEQATPEPARSVLRAGRARCKSGRCGRRTGQAAEAAKGAFGGSLRLTQEGETAQTELGVHIGKRLCTEKICG